METQYLNEAVYSEEDILELLGIGRGTLDTLRLEKGFPFLRLTRVKRVYLAKDVLNWLEKQDRESIKVN